MLRSILLGALVALGAVRTNAVLGEEAAEAVEPPRTPQVRRTGQPNRLASIRELAQHPSAESARRIVDLGLRQKAPAIRAAAIEALVAVCRDEEAARHVARTLEAETTRRNSDLAGPLAMSLLAAEDSPAVTSARDRLDDQAVASTTAATVLWLVANEAAQRADPLAVRTFVRLARFRNFRNQFGFRRAVISGLISARQPEAVEALVGMLGELNGEARGDVITYLTAISGEQHGTNAEEWARWWAACRDSFRHPGTLDLRNARLSAAGESDTYYDIPVYADRIVFVIDVSGSMEGPRMEAARRELLAAIDGLPPTTCFSVVAYNSVADVWRKTLVPADAANKHAASQYVATLVPGGKTASFDALDAAFVFDAEAIFFLSDGEPTAGRIIEPAAIVRFVTDANRIRRLSVYTIGVMPDRPLALFLAALAENNHGIYRQVDQ